MTSSSDVIFALASGLERAAIAVMRASGPDSGAVLSRLCGKLPAPRRASLRPLWRDASGHRDRLDDALVLWFPGPQSYTGEDSFELHLHAGPAVIAAVSEALTEAGARPAEAGEFTRRAFANGRLDLTEAEGIADLIAAETQAQRRQALAQADGALSRICNDWTERLRILVARQEALIDFPDEDLPPEVGAATVSGITTLRDELSAHLADSARGERIRTGLTIAIAGRPNAGKSSLLNLFAGRDAAIVSPLAGTTRDAIETVIVIGGLRVTLVDTAGLREAADPIEAEGVRRAMFHVKHADLCVQMFTANEPPEEILPDAILVCNKTDLYPPPDHINDRPVLGLSLLTEQGLDGLKKELEARVVALTSGRAGAPLTRSRHRAAVSEALQCLDRALIQEWPEIRGEDLRVALRALGRLTGAVGVEDILDTVFGQFCIGK
ncbi:tRNA uridine-5-carboxymethylaminomethyl(34) synthesis GTPase MnmE [Acetobacter sp. AN02]|uniref:tRNA uridine-5-carboxymethylaminomethyl(34) synthesis GTPase MnmE n=1 Tax=Acetobacter sp. AN02 TaxID=2894186 RepID=UPI0024344FAE|nr:tRNA uridine-5-carboxymethylaminomethyl(34) synthesis GTPase MnmE [Acetobacter sp. AN02]MDG6094896.1 tRNA uridine-5-carboxymethylaminomethyl(34) synthesis GTPase MnmE [Acetobacter sp. AN02]